MQYVMDCVASVKKYHESKKEPISGQVIYANRGKDFFLHLKEWLVTKIGYAPSEVEIISGGVSAKKKEQVKEHFLDGKVKIIIGSATIREGIDLQKRSTVLYNCFLDWNPTDIKQLEGRIWRFGNIYSHVRIVVPLIENSFDIFLNQKLGEKTARVNDIWSRAGRKTVLKLEELNPDELKKGLISDPLELVNMAVTEQTENLKTEKTLLEGYTEELEKVQGEIGKLDGLTQKIEAAVTRASNLFNYPSDVDPKRSQKISEMEAKTLKEKYQKVRAFSKVFIKTNFSEYYDLKRAVELHIDLNKKLKRIEKNILSKNNLTLSDNFLSLVAKFQRRREEIDRTIEHLESDENREKLLKAIEKEKAEKQINSRPLETRVNEFKRLNFLLECNSTPIHAENVCNIYGIQRGEAKVVPMEKDIPDKTIKTEAIIDLKPIPKDPSQALLKALTIAIKVAPQTRKMKLEKMRKGLELALRLRAKRKVS
jgi:RecG-like helicase